MIGEFGGIGAFVSGKEWVPGKCGTYLHVDTPAEEASTYVNMVFILFSFCFISNAFFLNILVLFFPDLHDQLARCVS
jgi:hypothetical protein